jgi:hypoxanthine phosphoribosyltransferase
MIAPLKPEVLLTNDEIKKEVARLAKEINSDYQGKQPLLLGILKGPFIFMADLVHLLGIPVETDFCSLSSYGSTRVTSGMIKIVQGLRYPIKGRDVSVIEDIVDTGLSVGYFLDYLRKRKHSSLRLCAWFDEPSRKKTPVHIDYRGFTIPDRFVMGYSLDYN